MSRPDPIEWSVYKWEITFSAQPFESSSKTGVQSYQAEVTWTARVNNTDQITTTKEVFNEFEDAKKWIDSEING
jgi:hypothetical protein